jgi:hypothetical protein
VYWTTAGTAANAYADGALMKVSRCGGSPTAIAPITVRSPSRLVFTGGDGMIAIDAANVYFTQSGAILQAPLAGGAPARAIWQSPGADVANIAADATTVYFTVRDTPMMRGGVLKMPVGGGAPATLATVPHPNAVAVASDIGFLYWGEDVDDLLESTPTRGGSVSALSSDPVQSVAVTSGGLYWTADPAAPESTNPVGSVRAAGRLARDNGVTIASSVHPVGIAADDANVYFTDRDGLRVVPQGRALGPSKLVVAAAPGDWFSVVVVDDTSVYWAANGATGGRVMKTAKP